MKCINKSHPDYKALVENSGLNPAILNAKIMVYQSENQTDEFPKLGIIQENGVNYMLKSLSILQTGLAENTFNKGIKNGWSLDKILTELAIPKEQKELILSLGLTDREDIILELASNYSYTVKIDVAKTNRLDTRNYNDPDNYDYYYETPPNERGDLIDIPNPTKYYSNLTVPGGTNYTEQEISTPAITPSIKGHAQFSTDNGIGWFRSDEQKALSDFELSKLHNEGKFKTLEEEELASKQSTKTRRILEVQSDLFQKGRDKKQLDKGNDWNTMMDIETNANKFLQLLNKNNNWVTFFVKSIIQDSAKKGYEKVLFPSGDTASKVEGHSTLEDFKKQKEDRIKELENDIYDYTFNNFRVYRKSDNTSLGNTGSKEDTEAFFNSNNLIKENPSNFEIRQNDENYLVKQKGKEINTLKAELERIEKEGFAALRPIYNFYENTVSNILKKQGFNPVVITDEYGNTWNEVKITPQNKETIFFNKRLEAQDDYAESVSRSVNKKKQSKFSFHSGSKTSSTSKIELEKLAKSNNLVVAKIAKKLLRSNKEVKINFISVPKSDNVQYNGIYKANVNQIYINKEAIGSREQYDAVMLEEIIHAETVYFLNDNNEFAKSWSRMYDKAKSMLPDIWRMSNELKNKEEFLAAVLNNRELQSALSRLPSIHSNPYRNLWTDIVQFFAELFKFRASERNLFTDLFDMATRVTEQSIDSDVNGTTNTWFKNEEEELDEVVEPIDEVEEYITEINNKFKDVASQIEKKADGYYINGKKIEKRVTELVTQKVRSKYNFSPRSEEDQELDKVKAESGTYVHDFIENAILRLVGNDIPLPNFKNKIQENVYGQVEKFAKAFLSQFEGEIKVFTELKVHDKNRNLAGTIDLVIITDDGTVHMYDWKTTSFKYDYKSGKVLVDKVPFYKEFYYKEQLGEYAKILKESYGVKRFGDVRAFPIRTIFESKKIDENKGWTQANRTEQLKSIEGLDFNDVNSKKYLRPVVSDLERTGNPKLDRLLDILIKRRDKIESEKIKAGTPEEIAEAIERKNKRLDEIKESILNIQLLHSIDTFVQNIDNEIVNAEKRGIDKLSNLEIEELESHIQFYTTELITLIDDVIDDKEESKRINNNINKVIAKSVRLKEAIVIDRKARVLNIGSNLEIDNINEVQKETGWWGRMMRTFSQQNHPKIRALYQLVFKSKDATERAHNQLNEEIQSKLKKLTDWGKSQGLNGTKVFDKMLRTSPNGSLRLISKYKIEYYDKLKGVRESQDLLWLKKNTVFNKEAFDKFLESRVSVWEKIYEGNKDAKEKIALKVEQFRRDNGNSDSALLNKSNRFIRPSDNWISDEYKYIQNNAPLKEFYDFFVEKTEEFRDVMGLEKEAGFVWAVEKDFIDSVFENGLGAFKGLGSITAQLESNPHQSVGMINEETGQIELSIPRYFINPKQVGDGKVDSSNQSRDLGRILSLAGAMSYNYKHMSEIKESVDILQQSLAPSENEVILTDGNGNSIKDKISGEIKKAFGSSSTLGQFNDYMNYYLYGQKFKDTKDVTFNMFGAKISGLKTYNWVSKWYVGKALSLNTVSITANIFGGNVSAAFVGAKSRYYNNTQYTSSLGDLSKRDKKAYASIGFFDIIGQNDTWKKANDLSVSSLTKTLTYDKLFFGQRAGDWQVRNSVLLSMLKSHTIKDGKILKKMGDEKSLYDMIELKDDKFSLLVDELELTKFRRKAIAVGERILGNSSRDDVRLLNLTLLGRSMMMFRNWIPTLVDERFGALRQNQDLGDYEMGRYRNFWAEFNDKKYAPVVRQVMGSLKVLQAYGLFGYGGKLSDSSKEIAKDLYAKYLEANPNIKMTENEFVQMHYENLRANGLEMWTMSLLVIMMVALSGGDDDKNKSSLRRYAIKQMQRNMNELSFFYSKASFDAILKSPIPITGALRDVSRFVGAALHHTEEIVTGDSKKAKGNEIGRATMKFFPTLSGIEAFMATAFEDWGKDEPKK